MKNKYIVFLLFFVVTDALAQDLKTTEINVVEGLKVSVPQPDKLNVKASFLDTTKVDKTQEYSFINKYIFSTFETRPLSAAKIKRKSELKSNNGNVNVSFGNRAFKFGNFNYSGKLKDKLIYGLGLLFDTYDYQTGNDNTKVSKDNFEFYVRTKRIFEKGVLSSKLTFQDIREFHEFSANQSPAKTYSEISASYFSRDNADDKTKHSSQLLIKDFNNQIENQIGLYSDLSSTINNIPFDLSFEYNNYLNYINHDPSIIVDEIDVKTLDITPNFSFDKFGFSLNLGFNLDIEIEPEKSVDVFPIIEVNKELVDNVVNLSFGIDRDDYRNTLSSLTMENPYIHTPAISASIEDSIGYFHVLETTDIYECFLNLDNKLSANEFLTLHMSYGKLINLHFFDFDQTTSLNRFNVNYINTWRFRSKIMYQRKFNNILSLYFDAQYNWYNEEIPYKNNLVANMSSPVTFGDKLKFIPSIKYIGKRKYSYMSGLFISPPEIVFDNLDDQYLVNLNIHYSYTQKLDFSIGVNNILDVQKPYWYGYDQIGLNFNFSLNYIL